jgi:hypothetical protein
MMMMRFLYYPFIYMLDEQHCPFIYMLDEQPLSHAIIPDYLSAEQ